MGIFTQTLQKQTGTTSGTSGGVFKDTLAKQTTPNPDQRGIVLPKNSGNIVTQVKNSPLVGALKTGLSTIGANANAKKPDGTPDVKKQINTAMDSVAGSFGGETGAVKDNAVKLGKDLIAKIPEAKPIAEKALSLNEKELGAVDKSKLKYLTDKGFDMTKTEGGVLKNKMYKMTDQVKSLANEFKNVLIGKTPEENIQLVQNELGRLQQESKTAFDGANKSINKNTLTSGIRKSITNMRDTAYEAMSKESKSAFTERSISDFMSHVKDGTLKGLDDALESFRSSNAKADATLSKANDATYQAVKKYIVDNLPTDKATVYKAANQSQAKLFDIAEILKGKIQASVGTLNKAGTALKWGAGAVGVGAVADTIKHFTGF